MQMFTPVIICELSVFSSKFRCEKPSIRVEESSACYLCCEKIVSVWFISFQCALQSFGTKETYKFPLFLWCVSFQIQVLRLDNGAIVLSTCQYSIGTFTTYHCIQWEIRWYPISAFKNVKRSQVYRNAKLFSFLSKYLNHCELNTVLHLHHPNETKMARSSWN